MESHLKLGGEAATAKRKTEGMGQGGTGTGTGLDERAAGVVAAVNGTGLPGSPRANNDSGNPLAASPASNTVETTKSSSSPYPALYDSIAVSLFPHPQPYKQPSNPYSALVDSQSYAVLDSFTLECGVTLRNVEVAYKTWGTLRGQEDGPDVGNAVVVCHALSGSADVADWWSSLLGPGRPLDPVDYFIVAFNVLGSPYGSSSPVTLNPATGRPYGPDFPRTTVRDDVGVQAAVLKALGVRKIRTIIGGSMGGFSSLEYPLLFPNLVKSIIPIATSPYHSAWTISWSETQRQAIFADPAYNNGRYPVPKTASKGHSEDDDHLPGPEAGLKAARMIALMTYRTRESLEGRFGRGRVPLLLPPTAGQKLGLIESENRGVLAAPAPEDLQQASSPTDSSWQAEFSASNVKEDILHNEGMPSNRLYDLKYEAGYGNRGGGKRSDDPPPNAPETLPAAGAQADRSKSLGGEDDDLTVQESDDDSEESEETRAVFFAQTYLRHHAAKFVNRFDANCYIAVTRKMDTHDVARGRAGFRDPQGRKWGHRERCAKVLQGVKCPALVLGVDSDNLYPLVEQQDLAAALPNSELKVIRSLHGHDGFLIEMSQVGKYLDEFVRKVPDLVKFAEAAEAFGPAGVEVGVDRPNSRLAEKL